MRSMSCRGGCLLSTDSHYPEKMPQFDLNILGCGSATPSTRHNPSCQVLNFRGQLMLIDCGEGAQAMMRRMHMNFSRISRIFISHMHGDHVFGLPGLLSTLDLHGKGGSVDVWMPADGVEIMRSITDYFCRETSFTINYHPVTGDGGLLYEDHALTVHAFPLRHRVPCYGYIFREKQGPRHLRPDMAKFYGIPVCRLNDIKAGADYVREDGTVVPNERLTLPPSPAVSYAYCSDTMFTEETARAVAGVDYLYHEATYDDSLADKARERGHSTAREAARIARMAGAGTLIIGHYSNRYTDVDILVRQAREEFPEVIAADEQLTIQLSK